MRTGFLRKVICFAVTFALLANSFSLPFTVFAQEATPEATLAPTDTPTPETTPEPTPILPEKEGTITTTTIENVDLSTVTGLDSPTVTTDKPDYSPTSIAMISGAGLIPNKTYTLTISSIDEPPITSNFEVTTDSNGTFTYAYQLDGNYRPNYKVEIKNGEVVVANTTFTDAVAISLYTNSAHTTGASQFTVGQTVYSLGSSFGGGKGYKFDVKNPAGTVVYTSSTCLSGSTGSDTFVPTSVSNSSDWKYELLEYANTSCTGGNTIKDFALFDAAQATVYSDSGLTTPQSTFGAGSTAYVVVNGLQQGKGDWDVTWVATGVSCANTGGGDRPDSDANGKLSSTYLAYAPADTFANDWNKLSKYESKTCSAFASGNAGQWQLTLTQDATHTVTLNVFTVSVTTTPTITFGAAPTPTYLGGNFTVSATTTNTDSSALTYSYVSGPCAFVSGATFSSSGAGTCVIQASGAATANFTAASNTQSVTIAKAGQATLTVTGLPGSASYAQAGITAGAFGGSGTGAVTFSAGASTACSVNSSTGAVTISSGSGTCSITATKAADTNYNSTTSDSVSITINQASSTTAITCPASEVYTDSALTPCTVSVTGAGGLSLTPTPTYASNTNVGTASVSYTYAGDVNHTGSGDSKTFEITPADSTTVVTFEAGPYTYRGSAFTATAKVTGVGGLDESVTVVYSGDCRNVTSANGCTATATFGGDSNHNGSTNSKSITITKADATCTISGYSGTYDASAHGASGSCTGVGEDGTLSGLDLGSTFTNVPGGTANWTFTNETGNYNNNSGSVAINISKADATILVTSYDVTYDGSSHTAGGSATGVVDEDLSADLNLTGTTHTNVGNYPTDSWTFTDSTGNYNNNSSIAADNIGKADQTIIVTTHAPAGAANGASFTVVATGGGSGNPVTYSSGTPSVCTNVGATFTMIDSVGTCTIQYDQLGNTNYNNATQITEFTEALLTISSEASSSVTDSSATVTWTTDHNATSRVVYDTVSHTLGSAPNYGYAFSTVEDPTLVTSHSVGLTGLTAGTLYYYRTISHGSPEAVSGEQTFTTQDPDVCKNIDGIQTGVPDGMHLDASGLNCVNWSQSGPAPRNDEGTGGQVLGIATSVPFKTWPVIAYNSNPSNDQVLGTETSTPSSTPEPSTINEKEKVGLLKWIATHKKISLSLSLLFLLILYIISRLAKNNKN